MTKQWILSGVTVFFTISLIVGFSFSGGSFCSAADAGSSKEGSGKEGSAKEKPASEKTEEGTADQKIRTQFFRIGGMTCGACAPGIEKAFSGVEGVKSAKVDYESGRATVETTDKVTSEKLSKVVKDAGFTATPIAASRYYLRVNGMTCGACVTRVDGAASAIPGVLSSKTNLAKKCCIVTLDDGMARKEKVISSIKDAGFGAVEIATEDISLKVTGMTCDQCTASVQEALKGVDGVFAADVDLDSGIARIVREKGKTPDKTLINAVAQAGKVKLKFSAEVASSTKTTRSDGKP